MPGKAHPYVQRELERPAQDLALLRIAAIDQVKAQAFAHVLLSDDELASLP